DCATWRNGYGVCAVCRAEILGPLPVAVKGGIECAGSGVACNRHISPGRPHGYDLPVRLNRNRLQIARERSSYLAVGIEARIKRAQRCITNKRVAARAAADQDLAVGLEGNCVRDLAS